MRRNNAAYTIMAMICHKPGELLLIRTLLLPEHALIMAAGRRAGRAVHDGGHRGRRDCPSRPPAAGGPPPPLIRGPVFPKRAFYASPAVVGAPGQQVLITANITGSIYALNLANGNTVYIHNADSAGIWSSPAASQNTIYITGKDGKLVTFAPSGAKR
jgi:hypothetical protein